MHWRARAGALLTGVATILILGLERGDLTGVVRDHRALRPGNAVVHVTLSQQPGDRVVLAQVCFLVT